MLPITRTFARNKLANMGDLELRATTAYKRYIQQMTLVAAEMQPFSSLFEQYKIERDTEKQAVVLARKAQSRASAFNYDYDEAEKLYKDALNIDGRSAYVLVSYAIFKRDLGQVSEAIHLFNRATNYANKYTGFFIYFNMAQVYQKVKERPKVEQYLCKALEYDPNHSIARHQLGLVLSGLGRYKEALEIFDQLIKDERNREGGPTETLVYTYNTKMSTLVRNKQSDIAKDVEEEAKAELKKWPHLESKLYPLK